MAIFKKNSDNTDKKELETLREYKKKAEMQKMSDEQNETEEIVEEEEDIGDFNEGLIEFINDNRSDLTNTEILVYLELAKLELLKADILQTKNEETKQ